LYRQITCTSFVFLLDILTCIKNAFAFSWLEKQARKKIKGLTAGISDHTNVEYDMVANTKAVIELTGFCIPTENMFNCLLLFERVLSNHHSFLVFQFEMS
jgi:hypothetical protein